MISTKQRQKMNDRPHRLGEMDKILIGNGGLGHRVLRHAGLSRYKLTPPKRRQTRQDKKEART